jgi:hypothetical protein
LNRGRWELLVRWEGQAPGTATWEMLKSPASFVCIVISVVYLNLVIVCVSGWHLWGGA